MSDSKRKLLQISVASPCTVDWQGMTGSEKIRHCGQCKKNVYNLSAMNEADVERLIARGDDSCIRYYYRPDGTIVTSNCADGSYRAPSKIAIGVIASMTTAVAFTGITALVESDGGKAILSEASDTQDVRVAMGGIRLVPRKAEKAEKVKKLRRAPEVIDEVLPEVEPGFEQDIAEVEPGPHQDQPDVEPVLSLLGDTGSDMPEEHASIGSAAPSTCNQRGWPLPLVVGLASLLGFFAVLRRSLSVERLQRLDAWSIPQVATVSSAALALAATSPVLQVSGSLLCGAGLAISVIAQRKR